MLDEIGAIEKNIQQFEDEADLKMNDQVENNKVGDIKN